MTYTKEQQLRKHKKKIPKAKKMFSNSCELCAGREVLSVHHIVYRSEAPKHEKMNHERNLILLCFKCHNSLHKNKKTREPLIIKRKLWELFNHLKKYEIQN